MKTSLFTINASKRIGLAFYFFSDLQSQKICSQGHNENSSDSEKRFFHVKYFGLVICLRTPLTIRLLTLGMLVGSILYSGCWCMGHDFYFFFNF
jgi:hypothetical protein